MSYTPSTDFVALLRNSSVGEEFLSTPGLDYVVSALARAGLINLYVGQAPPVSNQASTAWFVPASPSWTAEGVLYLWNSGVSAYQVATPVLWTALLAASGSSGYSFQSAPNASNVVTPGTSLLAIQRSSPLTTTIVLPGLLANLPGQFRLWIGLLALQAML